MSDSAASDRMRSSTLEHDWFDTFVFESPVGIFTFRLRSDGTYCFPYASARIRDLYGVSAAELARDAKIIFERVHPDDAEAARDVTLRSAQNLELWQREFRVLHPTRGEIWIEGHAVPSREPDGSTLWQGYLAEITTRKTSEKALRDREELLRVVTGAAQVGMVVVDQEYRYLFANDAYAELLRVNPASILGERVADVFSDVWHQIRPHLDRALNGERLSYELHLPATDAFPTARHLNVSYEPQPEDNGQKRVVAVITDITERKSSEDTIAKSEARYRTLFEYSPDGIVIVDENTRCVDANERMCEILGYSREQILGAHALSVVPRSEYPNIRRAREQIRHRRMEPQVIPVVRRDGTTLLAEVQATQIPGGNYLATVRDVTQRNRSERNARAHLAVAAILSAPCSLEAVIQDFIECLCTNLGWARGEFWRTDPERKTLYCSASWDVNDEARADLRQSIEQLRFHRGEGLPGIVWELNKPVWIRDVQRDSTCVRYTEFSGSGLHGGVGFPICAGNAFFGVVTLFNEAAVRRDTDLEITLSVIASLIRQFVERNRATEELRENEQRFRQLTDNIREVFWIIDPVNEQILYASPAYRTIWGREPERLYTSPGDWVQAVHPDDRDRVSNRISGLQGDFNYDTEYRIVRPDGSIRHIHDRGFPVRDASGEVYRIAGVAEDITDRREAEAASRLQKLRMEGIVGSAMDGIITVDEEQRIVLLNAAAERMFGYSSDMLLGKNLDCLIPQEIRKRDTGLPGSAEQANMASRTRGHFISIRGLRSDGEVFPIEASISHLNVEGHEHLTVTCRDVTERQHAEEMNKLLQIQLQQSQKMEAFGQLAGGVAHDFNNLLTVISGYSEVLQGMLSDDERKLSIVKEISGAGVRAASLTHQLLAFSRQQVLEPQILNINRVVADTEKMLCRLIGEDVQLHATLPEDTYRVRFDPGQMQQVIMNLAVNARDALPHGGMLTIETKNVELDETYGNAHAGAEVGNFVMLAVSDNGCGMTHEVQERIFEPFFTTKGVGKGTGLGLAVVHGIVKQSGGNIDVYSEVGVGTTFKVYLPAVMEPVSKSAYLLAEPKSQGSETILLVEDEENVRNLSVIVLESFGYKILTASCAREALAIAARYTGKISLLLTDVVMPEMSGRELAELLTKNDPTLKVLFMSGYTDDAIVRNGILLADVAFIQKPFTPRSLAKKVRDVLDESSDSSH